ncbi:MAG: chromosome segregation protein SMC [Gammaproteobacteria bacterium]|nr:chromosome segregation protein SMC [Gammaproteobacteria bacterium]
MRISKIRLAGFKSFVDPTQLHLPHSLTAIVGPNGCGKSNIIDAMLWVLGESSAKHLRGESMADVIFNGSNTRKPVGQASVEIVFDNAAGTLTGQYAGYAEIAVKRVIERDGLSHYFLNGTRCRRKDIIDTFLGTGVTKGGYSVIEQGMISRVIEARPEELRAFLEEAAGISKYKERRRETEHRIRRTRENLDRVQDINNELEKQLNHLARQVRSAERYQELKTEERFTRAQLLTIRWRDLDLERQRHDGLQAQRSAALAAAEGELHELERAITANRQTMGDATAECNRLQAQYYTSSAEVARAEQALQHAMQRREELQTTFAEVERTLLDTETQVTSDEERQQHLHAEVAALQPALQSARAQEQDLAEQLRVAERTLQEWQEAWDRFVAEANEASRAERIEQLRLEHVEKNIGHTNTRRAALLAEREQINPQAIESSIIAVTGEVHGIENGLAAVHAEEEAKQRELSELVQQIAQHNDALDRNRVEHQSLRGRIASLRQLQDVALGRDQVAVEEWLERNELLSARRLAEELRAESGWEQALETVLRLPLDTFCSAAVEQMLASGGAPAALAQHLSAMNEVDLGSSTAAASIPAPLLRDKVFCRWSVAGLLAGIYAVANREQALQWRTKLQPHESIVTQDGAWIGPNWIQLTRSAEADSVLQRQHALTELVAQADGLAASIEADRAALEELQRRRWTLENERTQLAARVKTEQATLATQRADLARQEAKLEQARTRLARIAEETAQLDEASRNDDAELKRLATQLGEVREQLGRQEAARAELTARRNAIRAQLDGIRRAYNEARERAHGIALKLENATTQATSVQQALARNFELREQMRQRRDDLNGTLAVASAPQLDIQQQLEIASRQRAEVEAALTAARTQLEAQADELRRIELAHVASVQRVSECRDGLEGSRLELRTLEVKCADLAEQLAATEYQLSAVLAELPESSNAEEWVARLSSIEQRIARLGPINLAALDEQTQASERKAFLDVQLKDLNDALNTLHEAMKKIDRETRTKFKETYDGVNAGMQRLFPTLFGGGHAYLEMTDPDLLETGVTVMARPPGKKNSTIHLLSGGEKALTALAFVFSLFELNPAPFCLLDEVDAPLDEANVVRFCQLVKDMAARVQMMVITHNKVTMEYADQLIGVTMQEAGVSRLVSVNMDQALAMVVNN